MSFNSKTIYWPLTGVALFVGGFVAFCEPFKAENPSKGTDTVAVFEMLEAEEKAAREKLARDRAELRQRQEENALLRDKAEKRAVSYWTGFDVSEVDLDGFDFSITEAGSPLEQREIVEDLALTTGFTRAEAVEYQSNSFDCAPSKHAKIKAMLEDADDLPVPIDALDISRISDYLTDRAALETGDCSCATQAVSPVLAWALAQRISNHDSVDDVGGTFARDRAMNDLGILMANALEDEMTQFCGRG